MVGFLNVSGVSFLRLFYRMEHYRSVDNGRKMCESLGLEYFKTVDVFHRCRCFGCSFKHKDGWSVTLVFSIQISCIVLENLYMIQVFGRHHADRQPCTDRQKFHCTYP